MFYSLLRLRIRRKDEEGEVLSRMFTREELIDKVVTASQEISTFHRQDFLNYRGRTRDTQELYSEVTAGWLLKHLSIFEEIPMIRRDKGYRIITHKGFTSSQASHREEERLAFDLFHQGKFEVLGDILDYQTPLKRVETDQAGKIDLLIYDGDCLRILELKKPQSQETMLRCVLEGYTYLKTIDPEKLMNSFEEIVGKPQMKASPLVYREGYQLQEFRNPEQKNLRSLMKALNSVPYAYSGNRETGYSIEEVKG